MVRVPTMLAELICNQRGGTFYSVGLDFSAERIRKGLGWPVMREVLPYLNNLRNLQSEQQHPSTSPDDIEEAEKIFECLEAGNNMQAIGSSRT